MQEEIWKDIKGFENIYRVSNYGRLSSNKRGGWRVLSNTNSKGDYLSVVLRGKDNAKSARIHRLVYEAFIGEIPKGQKFHIHHIDGDKQNNRADNLKLITSKEHHFIHIKNDKSILDGMIKYNKYVKTKKISQFDLNGNFIKTYLNGKDASDATGVCQRNILQVANKEPFNKKGNIRKQAGGFIWRFAE